MSRDSVAVQKRGYVDLQEMVREDSSITCSYGSTLPQDPTCTLPCSLTEADPSTFLIRGENYLDDRLKVATTYYHFCVEIALGSSRCACNSFSILLNQ